MFYSDLSVVTYKQAAFLKYVTFQVLFVELKNNHFNDFS